MGNQLVKDKAKDSNDNLCRFNTQALPLDDIFTKLVEEFGKEDLEKALPISNIQTTKGKSDFRDQSIVQRSTDEFTAGYTTSEYLVQQLQDQSKPSPVHDRLL